MDVQFLQQADWTLSKCGQPVAPTTQPPSDVSVVYRTKYFVVQQVVPAAGQPGSTQTYTTVISGDTNWELRSISANWFSGQLIYLQIQLPDGSYLTNVLEDDLIFAGYGSNRWVATRPIECPPGSKIIAAFDSNFPAASQAQNILMLLEGAYKYYVRSKAGNGHPALEAWAENQPRYLGNPNQNIMAPCWTQGYGPGTPDGFTDTWFTYSSGSQFISNRLFPGLTVPVVGGTTSAYATIKLERSSDFVCRRFYFWVAADATVTGGEFVGRIRISSGYAVTNDYLDLFRYVSGAVLPHDLNIKAGEQIIFELNLVDGAGTGNMYFAAFAEGSKRYPRGQSAVQETEEESGFSREVIIPAGGGAVRTLPPSMGMGRAGS